MRVWTMESATLLQASDSGLCTVHTATLLQASDSRLCDSGSSFQIPVRTLHSALQRLVTSTTLLALPFQILCATLQALPFQILMEPSSNPRTSQPLSPNIFQLTKQWSPLYLYDMDTIEYVGWIG